MGSHSPISDPDAIKHTTITLPMRILKFLRDESGRRRAITGSRVSFGCLITEIIDDWRTDSDSAVNIRRPPRQTPARRHRPASA